MANLTFTVDEVLQKVGALQLRVDQLERELVAAHAENKALRAKLAPTPTPAPPEATPDSATP